MSYIFISYSTKNKPYAMQLAEFFQQQGFDIWIDNQKIESGVNWWNAIVKGLQGCAAFVVVMTPESESSEWVQREVFLALEQKKPLFPLLLNGENWPVFVLTQFENVTHGGMPDADLCKRLGEYITPARKKSGADKTVLPVDPLPPHNGFDVHEAIKLFFKANSSQQWAESLNILGQIRASDEVPAFFDIDEFERKVQQAVEDDNRQRLEQERLARAQKEYETLLVMEQYAPDNMANALQKFLAVYPDYDPQELAIKYFKLKMIAERKQLFAQIDDLNTQPNERWGIGRRLAEIGDPRPGVGLDKDGLPDIVWCEVPAGSFLFGSNRRKDKDAHENEVRLQKVSLPTFYIAQYAVTVAQYEAFVQDGGYKNSAYWTQAGWQWKGRKNQPENYWQDPDWHIANHPVIGVTWYEAVAFCRWLSQQRGMDIRLPTEAEFEKAARGTTEWLYPYGDTLDANKGNTGASNIGRTSAVGMFPAGASPYGVLDMSGNVWEWSLSKWAAPYQPHTADKVDIESEAIRALRGGSWGDYENLVRVSVRLDYDPSVENGYLGFRVCRR